MIEEIEVNYDEQGTKKSVLLPYVNYEEFLAVKEENDRLKNKLREVAFLLSQFLEQQDGSPQIDESEIAAEEFEETEPAVESVVSVASGEDHDIRYYQHAKGFYTKTGGFCVLAGSKARGRVSPTFERLEGAVKMRKRLIDNGVLTRSREWEDYKFTKDHIFNSPSAAATLVDGNSRSGPESWGRRRY